MSFCLTYEYPDQGFNLLCFDNFMYAAPLNDEFLPVEKRKVKIGNYILKPEKSRVVQIGDSTGSAMWTSIEMPNGNSLLFLGVFPDFDNGNAKFDLLVFQWLKGDQPRQFQRNLFGDIERMPYKNLLVVIFFKSDFLGMTTRFRAGRTYKPVIKFEK